MLKKRNANVHDICLVYISKWVSLISVTYVVGTHWDFQCAPTTYVHSINECFHHKAVLFTNFSTFMFQCYEHVEMSKYLCSLACTWMTIIDIQLLTAYR